MISSKTNNDYNEFLLNHDMHKMRKKCCDMVKISSNIILYVEFSQSYYFILSRGKTHKIHNVK